MQQVSEQLGVSTTHIWDLENGHKSPNVALVFKVSDVFGVTAEQLIQDELEVDGAAQSNKWRPISVFSEV